MSKLIGSYVHKQFSFQNIKAFHIAYVPNICASHLVPSRNTTQISAFCRCYCSKKKDSSSLTKVKSGVGTPATFKEVKETTKTVSYLGVIVIGVGVTGIIMYQVFRELFSSKSSSGIYSASIKKCCEDPRVMESLGEPIKGFGEETRRGRRRHVSHLFYEREGVNCVRMKYYLQGSKRRGTVHLEMCEDEKGDFKYRYLFVQLDDFPRNTIIIEDNRHDQPAYFDKPLEFA